MESQCDHPLRSSRSLFYATLFKYSSRSQDDATASKGNNAPISSDEEEMMAEWILICDSLIFTLGKLTPSSLPGDEKVRQKLLRDDHRLSLFARDVGVENPIDYILAQRALPFSCECNDTRCICGEKSLLSYIYNTKTKVTLTVGTTCAGTVKMASVDGKRCGICNDPIRAYTKKNMGRCPKCSTSTVIHTGERANQSLSSVVMDEKYDPSLDPRISLLDAMRIERERSRMCSSCKLDIHRGVRGDESYTGWTYGRLCATCVIRTRPTLESGEDALTAALVSCPSTLSERDQSLVDYVKSLFCAHEQVGLSPVQFGKYAYKKMKCELLKEDSKYVDWCRTCDNPSHSMLCLLAYADLDELYKKIVGK